MKGQAPPLDIDLASYRAELDLPDDVAAVNAGSWGPLCRAARDAIADFTALDARLRVGDHTAYKAEIYYDALERDRTVVADLIGCRADEVALCESTTSALNIVLWGLDLAEGDEIVSSRLENPAAVVPLRNIASRRGAEIRWLDFQNGSTEAVDAFARAITPRTRLLLLSDVDFATGARVDLRAISELAQMHRIFVLADGAQAAGTSPIDVKALGVDAYAFARHKFLCGPDGAGILYLGADAIATVNPSFTGVFSDVDHGMGRSEAIYTTSHRFDVSTRAVSAIVGATAATSWIQGITMDTICRTIESRREALRSRLQRIPRVRLISPPESEAGVLTFAVEGIAADDVLSRLAARKIFGRTITVTEPQGVRLSIGWWTREEDLAAIEEAVTEIAVASREPAQ